MPIKIQKTQWGLIMRDTDYSRIDALAASRGETRQEYVRRATLAAVERDEKKGGARRTGSRAQAESGAQ